MVMSVFEGFSGWLVVLEEAVALAVALNRVLVLLCFRAGKLRPCTPWAPIRGPPALAYHPAAAAAGPYAAWQTLARQGAAGFPAFAYDCPGNGSELLPAGSADDAFSLDAFFSPAGIDDILARGLARLRSVRGVPLPRRPRGFYRVHTVPFSEWLRATYPGRRITRPLHFNVAAVDLMTNRDCAWEATTSKYFVGDNYVFMGGKLCLGAPGDSTVSGLGYDLGWLAQPHWQAQPLVAVVKWQRSHMLDMKAALPFPQPHASHFALVRAWLLRHRLSTASLDRLASTAPAIAPSPARHPEGLRQPAGGDCSGGPGDGAGSFAVAQWRTETLGPTRFDECSRLVIDAVGSLMLADPPTGASCSSAAAANSSSGGDGDVNRTVRSSPSRSARSAERTRPVVLVTDLPTSGNPCVTSFNYNRDQALLRSQSPLLGLPGVLKYDRDLLEARIPLFDAGVLSLHEYLVALAAPQYSSCNTRGKSDKHRRQHAQCHHCFWVSEFIARIVKARELLGLATDETFLDKSRL